MVFAQAGVVFTQKRMVPTWFSETGAGFYMVFIKTNVAFT
jgi:hypothetical protein